MDFEPILDRAIDMLQHRRRVTYRTIKRQFQLDDDGLADLKAELLYAHSQVADDEGVGLIWTGDAAAPGTDRRRRSAAEDRFYALLPEVIARLRSQRRVTYRTLQYLYGVDAALLAAMREELAFRRFDIARQILSLPGLFSLDSLPVDESFPLLQLFNDDVARLSKAHPEQFAGLAALPEEARQAIRFGNAANLLSLYL